MGQELSKSQAAALGLGVGGKLQPQKCESREAQVCLIYSIFLESVTLLQHSYKSLAYSLAKPDEKCKNFFFNNIYYCLLQWLFLKQNLGTFPFTLQLCTNYKDMNAQISHSCFLTKSSISYYIRILQCLSKCTSPSHKGLCLRNT